MWNPYRNWKKRREGEQLRKQLEEISLGGEETRKSAEAKKAIAYCRLCVSQYDDWFEWNEQRWVVWQTVVIVGGVIATLAALIDVPEPWKPWTWLRAVPAALAAIAGGLLSSFTYREDCVRQELTGIALQNELVKFVAKAAPYDGDEPEATSLFINNVGHVLEIEGRDWRSVVMGSEFDKRDVAKVRKTPKDPAT
jgi:hypothetical protein